MSESHENESQRREYYIGKLVGNDTKNNLVLLISQNIYNQLKDRSELDQMLKVLEETGRVGQKLYKSFYTFNLYVFEQFRTRKIEFMPQNMPLAYAQAVVKNFFSFENFVSSENEQTPFDAEEVTSVSPVQDWSVEVSELADPFEVEPEPELEPEGESDSNIWIIVEKPKE